MTLRLTARVVTLAMRRSLAQPGALLVNVGFYLVVVAVLSALWRTAAEANGGAVAGYTALALTWYIATSEAAVVAIDLRTIDATGTAIIDGTVTGEMLRPTSVVGLRIASAVGATLPRLAALAAAGAALSTATAGAPVAAGALALAAPSLVLAVVANIAAQHAFAASSFWLRDARSAWFLYQKLIFILGGMLLPLEVLPDALASVARVLPFVAMAYAPARLASGHFEPEWLALQALWCGVLVAAAVAVFAAGERRLRTVGG